MMTRYGLRVTCLILILVPHLLSSCVTLGNAIDPVVGLAPPIPPPRFHHEDFDRVLRTFVDARGRVDYRALRQDSRDLDRYYALVAAFSPDSHPELFPTLADRLAYWLNAYNATVLVAVLAHYPVDSVSDVKTPWILRWLPARSGFFVFQGLTYGGARMNLYRLENEVIRERYRDARVHFALNCGSRGCPRLPRRAFTADALDAQLDREARRFLAEERNVLVDHENRRIVLSTIFDWYREDFLDDCRERKRSPECDILEAIAPYLDARARAGLEDVRGSYEVVFADYDWALNDVR